AVFLLHARSALVASDTRPVAMLVSLAGTRWLGINGNIMSLGGIAIAIGAMIDAAIVMLENLHKHVEHEPDRPHWERVFAAAREVGPATIMSLLIPTLPLPPACALAHQEARQVRPLRLAARVATAAGPLLALQRVPALRGCFVEAARRPARARLQLALQEARGLRAASLGPELLLLGVLRVLLTTPAGSAGATLATLLNAAGLTPERVRDVIARGDQA